MSRLIASCCQKGLVSARAIAVAIGVSDRTVRRWLDGTDRPDIETQEMIAHCVEEQRERIAAARPEKCPLSAARADRRHGNRRPAVGDGVGTAGSHAFAPHVGQRPMVVAV